MPSARQRRESWVSLCFCGAGNSARSRLSAGSGRFKRWLRTAPFCGRCLHSVLSCRHEAASTTRPLHRSWGSARGGRRSTQKSCATRAESQSGHRRLTEAGDWRAPAASRLLRPCRPVDSGFRLRRDSGVTVPDRFGQMEMRVALDTIRLTDLFQGDAALAQWLGIWAGFHRGTQQSRMRLYLQRSSPRPPSEFCSRAGRRLSTTRGSLCNSNGPAVRSPIMTSGIAALVLEHDLRLVTRDRHFERIPQLLRG
jgi:predicted nucleic acid-binding protein